MDIETNRYPDPDALKLRRLLSKRWKVSTDKILHGNGSDELIYYLIATFGGPVLCPVPTFSMYNIISAALGEKTISIPLDENFDLDMDRMLDSVKADMPKIIFISSPNNPTGNSFSDDKIVRLIESFSGIIVVDEAYQPFSDSNGLIGLISNYRNLVILRTLSKIGLASLRLGFIIADPEIVGEVNKVRLPFNVNTFSQYIAIESLRESGELRAIIKEVRKERRRLFKELSKLNDVTTFPSDANFILFKVQQPEVVYRKLLKKGVLIRNVNNSVPGCLRVTIGRKDENRFFLNSLKDVLKNEKGGASQKDK